MEVVSGRQHPLPWCRTEEVGQDRDPVLAQQTSKHGHCPVTVLGFHKERLVISKINGPISKLKKNKTEVTFIHFEYSM